MRLSGILMLQPVDQIDLGADRPGRSRGRRRDRVDDELGRAIAIGRLDDLEPALRMDDHVDVRVGRPGRSICSTENRAWTEQ